MNLYNQVLVGIVLISMLSGCAPTGGNADNGIEVPRGYVSTLQLQRNGENLRFGPFVGYYFRPPNLEDLTRLDFICFNEQSFYTRDVPSGTKLFEGTAILADLPIVGRKPRSTKRIHPVFWEDVPVAWRNSRPADEEGYRHFHSCYNQSGASMRGYWLRHVAVTNFVYDMGGRVDPTSPLYHVVSVGIDTNFAQIVEFDAGPTTNE